MYKLPRRREHSSGQPSQLGNMPFGISLFFGKTKPPPPSEQTPITTGPGTMATDAASGDSSGNSFRLTFLGKQALSRPTNTGFGSVQKPLRDIYLAYAAAAAVKSAGDSKLTERNVLFDGHEMQVRFWDPGARQFQQEVWPLDCVTYLDLVMFQTVRGKRREFGYFRRHTDSTDVIPDSVLIPLHKREVKSLSRLEQHKPLLCFLIRRPHGIQFLECHVYRVDSEASGLAFMAQFDGHSRAKLQDEKRSQLFNYAPWQPGGNGPIAGLNKWASQPALGMMRPPAADAASSMVDATGGSGGQSEMSGTPNSTISAASSCHGDSRQRMHQSSGNVSWAAAATPVALVPSSDGGGAFVVVASAAAAAATPASKMRRTASGTIFDKYKELQAFNIPEQEYMGFQEMQQQLQQRREQRVLEQPHQQPQAPLHRQPQLPPPTGLAASSAKFPSDGSIRLTVRRQQPQPADPAARRQQPQPAVVHLRQRAAPVPSQHHRPSTILEEAAAAAAAATAATPSGSGLPAAAADTGEGKGGSASVASLVNRFEQIRQPREPTPPSTESPDYQHRPVARVLPTSRHPKELHQQQQHPALVDKARPAGVPDQHRIHRSVSGGQSTRQQLPPQHSSSTPGFAAALGYLP